MHAKQLDLFAGLTPRMSEEALTALRARLHERLAFVQNAATVPWPDQLGAIHEDNGFRSGCELLPAEERAALWAAFDVEMDRLYALMGADCAAAADAEERAALNAGA